MPTRRILITWPGGLPRQSYDLAVLEGAEGKVRTYHRNGQLMAAGTVVDRLQHGLWKFWNHQGGRNAAGRFEHGMPRGEWIYYEHDREYRVVQWQVLSLPEFRISLPQGWHRQAREGHALFSREDPADEHGPSIAISCHEIHPGLAIRDFTLQLLHASEHSLRHLDFQVQEMEACRIRSLDACEALTTVTHKGQRVQTRLAFIKQGSRLFKLQAVVAAGKAAAYNTLFLECLRSFLLLDPHDTLPGLDLVYPPELSRELDRESLEEPPGAAAAGARRTGNC